MAAKNMIKNTARACHCFIECYEYLVSSASIHVECSDFKGMIVVQPKGRRVAFVSAQACYTQRVFSGVFIRGKQSANHATQVLASSSGLNLSGGQSGLDFRNNL